MKTLRKGSKGELVEKWQNFLVGLGARIVADGDFGENTRIATVNFQKKYNLTSDGVVGNTTYGKAMLLGFNVIEDDSSERNSADWPAFPGWWTPNDTDRKNMFGDLKFNHTPTATNKEKITITNGWDRENIVKTFVPQIKGKMFYNQVSSGEVLFHKKGVEQFLGMWEAWQKAGLLSHVLTWNGSYCPRLIRGSDSRLSNHAYGTAFDINVKWNGLGRRPALVGQEGSVRELVPLANKYGFFWGGHYNNRKDGMHFELAKFV